MLAGDASPQAAEAIASATVSRGVRVSDIIGQPHRRTRPAPSNGPPCRDRPARPSRLRAACPAGTGRRIGWCRGAISRRLADGFRLRSRRMRSESDADSGDGWSFPAVFWWSSGGFLVVFWLIRVDPLRVGRDVDPQVVAPAIAPHMHVDDDAEDRLHLVGYHIRQTEKVRRPDGLAASLPSDL